MRSVPRDAVLALLALGAALWLPVVMAASGWLPGGPAGLYRLATLAWVTALALAVARRSDNASRLTAVTLGLLAGAHYAGRVLPSPALVGDDIERLASWAWRLVVEEGPAPEFPLSYSAGHLYWQTRGLLERLGLWAYNLRQGIPDTDNTALLLATAVGVWVLAFNATHELVARQRAFAGLLPVALAVGANVYLGRMSDAYVYAYLGVLVVALVWANVSHMEQRWARAGLSPRRGFRLTSLGVGIALGALALVAALSMPNATYAWTFHTFWREHGARIESFYRRIDDAFAGRNPIARRAEAQAEVVTVNVIEVPVTPTAALATLPGHTVGAGVDLGDEPLMWVTLDRGLGDASGAIAASPAKFYWRERTYDTYTGRGWTNGSTEATSLPAQTPWSAMEGPRLMLAQTYTLLRPSAYAFGVNEPVSLDADSVLLTRGPGDLVALSGAAERYTVLSHVPAPGIAELRAAEGEYPAWVRERYLALPPIPERVRAEAYRIASAAGATTRYDKARAVEAYLRGLTYDLEVPAPPAGADVVDHFLLETRAGFCDHSASAMTVLLRSLGVAARYASGYGMGEYHAEEDAWLVTSANAHAWVEVYFPGVGWIEFEPTPAQSPFQRPEARPTTDPALAPLATPTSDAEGGQSAGPTGGDAASRSLRELAGRFSWLAAVVGVALLWVVAAQRPRWLPGNGHTPRQEVLRVYRRLTLVGRWLGVDTGAATPRETLNDLQRELQDRFGPHAGVAELVPLYERARYGAAPVSWSDAEEASALWRRARDVVLHRGWRLLGGGHAHRQ